MRYLQGQQHICHRCETDVCNIWVLKDRRCVTHAPVDFCNNLNQMRTESTQTESPIK